MRSTSKLLLGAAAGLAAATLGASSAGAADRGPVGTSAMVSPGEADRNVEVEARCPTFSWAATAGARGSELLLLRLPDEEMTEADPVPVFRKVFREGVGSWTPALGDCLERGASYAWTVRAIDGASKNGASEWPDPLLFRISPLPSLAEVEQALEVLRAHGQKSAVEAAGFESGAPASPERPAGLAEGAPIRRHGGKSPDGVIASAAIRGTNDSTEDASAGVAGESTATSGFSIGVAGATASPGGAGVVAFASDPAGGIGLFARSEGAAGAAIDAEADSMTGSAAGLMARANAPGAAAIVAAHRDPSGGADVLLDGSEQSVTDTSLTESGLDRASAGSESFALGNSGGGGFQLGVAGSVDADAFIGDGSGLTNVTPGPHQHTGEDVSSGTVADARIASTLSRDSEVFGIVTANDGSGSGLDADLIDGVDSSAFAAASHAHSGADITSGTVADARIASTLARDSEVFGIVTASDGSGSGLDADLLDGADSSAFAGAVHGHSHSACPVDMALYDLPESTLCVSPLLGFGDFLTGWDLCFETYGAGLCSYRQWRIAACTFANFPGEYVWTSDRVGQDLALTVVGCGAQSGEMVGLDIREVSGIMCCAEWPRY